MVEDRALMFARLLVSRLEHLSADSVLAHQASGLRGSILIYLEECFIDPSSFDPVKLDGLLENGYRILDLALRNSYGKKKPKLGNGNHF